MTVTIDAAQVEKLAAVIADFLGVPRDTFAASMKDDATVEAAWRRGRRAPVTVGQLRLRQPMAWAGHRWRAWPDTRW
jgi:hypothetical protein